ncbi:signal peptidase II [Amycolatopsis arida]|uniref:Lipoprotein signal peptidase n=1 Tax=Amycolatopsis arida TaxID=587909 RepID=A0A1I5XIT0_9PSEU|nr:signal peptidase II [Amycolatopsis arida]SFQ31872.1 signal peptidase II [Amycolatopsis arida]
MSSEHPGRPEDTARPATPAQPDATAQPEPPARPGSDQPAGPDQPDSAGGVDDTDRPPRRIALIGLVALVVLALDVATKVLATATLEGRAPVEVLGGLVYLQLVRNPGAAFSMATGMTWLLTIVAMAVVVAIVWLARRLRSTGWAIGLGLVLAGALGNLVDRIFRAPGPLRGHVVDFVSVFAPNGDVWPVFNVADSAIVVGAALIVLLSLLGRDYDGTSSRRRARGSGR